MAQTVQISDLAHYYKNARIGDLPKIKKSLEKYGQYQEIVVNQGTHTGRPMEILVGNHVTKAATDLGWTELEARIVDVDDATAAGIVAVDNKTGESGTYDKNLLADLLELVPDIRDVGFTTAEMDELMRETARGAEAAISAFSHQLDQQQEAQRAAAPAAAPVFSSSDVPQPEQSSAPAPVSAPPAADYSPSEQQQAPEVAPAADPEPYFTVSYTVTGPEREIIHQAIRQVQATNDSLKSPQALVEICRRVIA